MIRSTFARVDLAALKSNFAAIRSFLSRSAQAPASAAGHPPAIIGVVKANAYGHGAPRVALALQEAGATMLACADIEEGIVLRQAGVRVPILVFGALSVSNLDGLFRVDYRRTGDTWWEVYNTTVRDPIQLVDARAGVKGGNVGVYIFGSNIFDEEYNAEFSPGGFVFKARPRVYGVEASFEF